MSGPLCIGCGCDDDHPCVDAFEEACCWVEIDRTEGVGVCSCCPDHVDRFNDGDRTPAWLGQAEGAT